MIYFRVTSTTTTDSQCGGADSSPRRHKTSRTKRVLPPFSKFCAFVVGRRRQAAFRAARQPNLLGEGSSCAQAGPLASLGQERQASGEHHPFIRACCAGLQERWSAVAKGHLRTWRSRRSWCGGRGVPRRCRPCTGTRAGRGSLRHVRSSTLPPLSPLDLVVNATRRGSLARVGHRSPIEGRCCRAPVLGPAPWRLPPLIPISPAAAARLGKENEQTQQAPACQRHEHEGAVREQRASDLAGGQGLMAECMVGAAGHRVGRLHLGVMEMERRFLESKQQTGPRECEQ